MRPLPRHATYANAGVNLDLGDTASQALYTAARRTREQRCDRFGEVIIPRDDFSGVRYIGYWGSHATGEFGVQRVP